MDYSLRQNWLDWERHLGCCQGANIYTVRIHSCQTSDISARRTGRLVSRAAAVVVPAAGRGAQRHAARVAPQPHPRRLECHRQRRGALPRRRRPSVLAGLSSTMYSAPAAAGVVGLDGQLACPCERGTWYECTRSTSFVETDGSAPCQLIGSIGDGSTIRALRKSLGACLSRPGHPPRHVAIASSVLCTEPCTLAARRRWTGRAATWRAA